MSTIRPTRFALYVRLSVADDLDAAPDGEAAAWSAGIDRQRADVVAAARRRGLPPDARTALYADPDALTAPAVLYVEDGESAWKLRTVWITDHYGDRRKTRRVVRPVWAQMMRDLRAGKFTHAIVYNSDRMARDPYDTEDVIETARDHGVTWDAASGSLDLSTDDGRAMLRVMTAMANKQSADTARRLRRKYAADRAAGKPHWTRTPFGHNTDGTINPDEAEAIRDAAQRIIDGSSLRDVCVRWDKDGRRTAFGNLWTPATIGDLLRSPRLAGWMPDGASRGNFASILSDEQWRKMLRALRARRTYTGKPGAAGKLAWLLSGIAVCARCDAPAYIRWMGGREAGTPYYTGRCGHVSVRAADLDALVTLGVTIGHAVGHSAMIDVPTADTAPLVEALDRIDARLERARAAYMAEAITVEELRDMTADLKADRVRVQADLDRAEAEAVRAHTVEALGQQWADLDLSQRRELLRSFGLRIAITPGFGWEVHERLKVAAADLDLSDFDGMPPEIIIAAAVLARRSRRPVRTDPAERAAWRAGLLTMHAASAGDGRVTVA